jgi:predicted RNA-binding Zn-ribbon protein involved in translation (DUF1610 family)
VNSNEDIPELPGHFGVIRRRMLAAAFTAIICPLSGILFSGHLTPICNLALLLIFVTASGIAAHAFMSAKRARCPQCGNAMTQGWDAIRHRSTGLFACNSCGTRWRTDAIYAFGD